MSAFITQSTPVTDAVLKVVAHLPTKSLAKLVEAGFFQRLEDKDSLGVALYRKYAEEKPEQAAEDWKGVAALRASQS
jgi:hypothetical protein